MPMYQTGASITSCTWANRPTTAALWDRIRVTDFGVPSIIMVWDGTRWIPDGPQVLGRSGVVASLTGTLTETALATITVPANMMGLNGGLLIMMGWSYTSSANTKTFRARFGGIAGVEYLLATLTTNVTLSDQRRIRNRNSASSQTGQQSLGSSGGFGGSSGLQQTSSIDTTADTSLVLSAQLANTGDTARIETYDVWLLP